MRLAAATALLSRSEFCVRKGNSDIYRLREASSLESFDSFRTQFSQLAAAGDLVQLILRSQFSGKPAPLLYQLFLTYLRRLALCQNPSCLIASFQLKLLKHEGVFAWSPAIPSSLDWACFSSQEWETIGYLTGSRSFAEIENLPLPPLLPEKAAVLFEKLIR